MYVYFDVIYQWFHEHIFKKKESKKFNILRITRYICINAIVTNLIKYKRLSRDIFKNVREINNHIYLQISCLINLS